MEITLSDKFRKRWDDYLDYCALNYGKALAEKKSQTLFKILNGILAFPESNRIEPLLKGMDKVYRAVNFDKIFRIIYTINDDKIIIENLWNTKMSPNKLKKDI